MIRICIKFFLCCAIQHVFVSLVQLTGTWINMDVTISSFKVTPYGAYGNVKYDISFEEARELKIYTTKELKIGGLGL